GAPTPMVTEGGDSTEMADTGTMETGTMEEGSSNMSTDMAEGEMAEDGSSEVTTETVEITEADEGTMTGDDTMQAAPGFSDMVVADLIGMNVEGQDGDVVGEIDYVIERAGALEAVIGIGGFLGLGEYTVALPLDRFEMNEDRLILDGETEAELRNMPEIDESELEALDGETPLS
ncbi:MAG: PRC-barrel domain-containing protein, partial [Shimia sp.]